MWVRREMCRRMSGGRRSSGACRARVLVDLSVAGLLTRGSVSGGKCVAASRGQRCSSGACRARALVDLSVAGVGRCLRVSGRRLVSACRGGRRSGGAWRARTLADRSVAGSWLHVRKSGGKCVARDESGRRRTRHDMGRQISPARQMNTVVTNRKEIDSSDGWRRRVTVTEKAVPIACGVPHAFNSHDAARHKIRMNRPANMSSHVAATHIRAAHDTCRPMPPLPALTRPHRQQPCLARHARDRRDRRTHSSYLETARHV